MRKKRPLLERIPRAARAFLREVAGTPALGSATGPFKGAEQNRLFYDWMTSIMSPDDETKASVRALRARARDLARNNGLAIHYLNLLETNVIGPTGFTLVAQIKDRAGKLATEINKKLETAWTTWAQTPVTLDEQLDWVGFQNLALRTVAIDGECFIRIWRGADNGWGFAFEMIDADLVDETLSRVAKGGKNEIRMGIEVDAYGRRIAYHIRTDPAYSGTGAGRITHVQIPAHEIIHLYLQRRPNQTRGITWFSGAMWALRQEGGYIETELVTSRAAALKSVVYYTDPDGAGSINPQPGDEVDEAGNPVAGGGGFREDLEPGTGWALPAGWKAQVLDPSHPTSAFPDFIKAVGRRIATALSVSYNILMNDLEGVSFSSIRSWTISERDLWKKLQGWWRFAKVRRVFNAWLDWMILTPLLDLGSRNANLFRAVKHVARSFDWVDPEADVNSTIKQLQWLMTSPQRVAAERGLDYGDLLDEVAAARKMAEERDIPWPVDAASAAAENKGKDQGGQGEGGAKGGRLGQLLDPSRDRPPSSEPELAANGNGHRGGGE